jgi:hypothetical protein
MTRILIAGYQHETNTFAPTPADYAAFESGGGWPGLCFGEALLPTVSGANIPAGGAFIPAGVVGRFFGNCNGNGGSPLYVVLGICDWNIEHWRVPVCLSNF